MFPKFKYRTQLSSFTTIEKFQIALWVNLVKGMPKVWRKKGTGDLYHTRKLTKIEQAKMVGFLTAMRTFIDEDELTYSSWEEFDEFEIAEYLA